MVNKLYFAALLLGHATASPVIPNGAMQARDDDVTRAAAIHARYLELVEPRHDDKSGYDRGDKGYTGDDYSHKKPDDYGHKKPDDYGHKKPDDYGHKKPDDYGHKKPDDYGHRKPDDYGHKKPDDYGHMGGNYGYGKW